MFDDISADILNDILKTLFTLETPVIVKIEQI